MQLNLSQTFLTKLGTLITVEIRKHVRSGRDINNKTFRGYSGNYADKKSKGKFKRQRSHQISPPDLTLTGDMLRDLQVLETGKNAVQIGWTGPFAERVAGNEMRGRIISLENKVFPIDIDNLVDRKFAAEFERLGNKDSSTQNINIRI